MSALTVLDGGMGKELRRIGAPFRQPEWSSLALMEAPDMVIEAHRNFIAAGAQVITTNNYAVVPYHHAPGFFDAHGAELTTLAGRLARTAATEAARDTDPDRTVTRVAGSMPPLFGSYEPRRFDRDRAVPIYAEIAEALDPFVDFWLAETLSTVGEMRTIVEAVRPVGEPRPIWVSFSVPDVWDEAGIALRSGETFDEIVAVIVREGLPVDALLVNCSLPEQTGPALRDLRRALCAADLDIRTGGYANAFPTERDDDYAANEVILERRPDLTADRYCEFVAEWIEQGATIVGGCCDMYPEHIAALSRRFA